MPSSNPLPPKENTLFKRILKCYEQKQYKNGLKFAKQILTNPKFTEHGETHAMKGLILNCLGRKEEAFDHVRRGLRNDLQSHVCWHVFGLLQRADKKYDEAIKCYRNALKWDKDNIQILRDLSLLQIQMRDLEGYRDTRYQLFMLRPTQRASWIGYAMSYHLLKEYDMALRILEEFRKTQVKAAHDYELSELLLYQTVVLMESEALEDAEKHVARYEKEICDKRQLLEMKGDLSIRRGDWSGAALVYRSLIERNPHNKAYYLGLVRAMRLNEGENNEERIKVLKEYADRYPRAIPPRRLPLDWVEGDRFVTLLDAYLRPALTKGVSPLFVDLRPLMLRSSSHSRVVEETLLGYVKALQSCGKYNESDPDREPATTLLWCYYFLAQYYDLQRDPLKALSYVDRAMEHTPTLIELEIVKARIYKHAGDVFSAWRCMEEAQSLDTADRYLNSKCAKYMLRANIVEPAEVLCGKFTREGAPAMESLNEMQCMWFQTECALAFQRMGQFGEGLKKCHEVGRHFQEILEDQFDFHTYCLRKMTLCSYVGLLRLEDVLQAHPFYLRAARCAIEIYLRLHDNPLPAGMSADVSSNENLSPAELRKLRNKQKKAKKRAAQAAEEAAALERKKEMHRRAQNQPGDSEADSPKHDALDTEKLVRTETPLSEAEIFLRPLQCLCPKVLDTHLLAFEIVFRKGRLLLMLQSLKRAWTVNPSHPRVHSCLVRFLKRLQESKLDAGASGDRSPAPPPPPAGDEATPLPPMSSPVVQEVVREHLSAILPCSSREEEETAWDPQRVNADFLLRHPTSLEHVFEGARMMYWLDPSTRARCAHLVLEAADYAKDASLQVSSSILSGLESGLIGSEEMEPLITSLKSKCRAAFPLATVFRDASEPPPEGNHVSGHENGTESEST